MLGVVLGIAAVGAIAWGWYEMATREKEQLKSSDFLSPAQLRQPSPNNVYDALAKAIASQQPHAGSVKLNPVRAMACLVQPTDLENTEAWTAERFGVGLPLTARLHLMANTIPPLAWPTYARRIYCALLGN